VEKLKEMVLKFEDGQKYVVNEDMSLVYKGASPIP